MPGKHPKAILRISGRALAPMLFLPIILGAQTTLLVDFGSNAGANTFGLPGWSTALTSANLSYTSAGPGGVVVASDPDELTDFMGVRGSARNFVPGERIVATWYNTSNDTIYFTARLSFNDSDRPDGGSSGGEWYTMRRFDDYRRTYSKIAPGSTCRTAFNITSSGVHKTDGSHDVVNLCLAVEWGQSEQKRFLICDKIELLSDADIQPPGAPTGLRVTGITHRTVQLEWNAPSDNVGVVEYLIFANGRVEGYSRSANYTAVLLNPSTQYSFTVAARDHSGNTSMKSGAVPAATSPYSGGSQLITPAGFDYLGAFSFPESANWGGEGLAHSPLGDGGPGGAGAADGYPGSLFTSNINTPESGFIGEFSIPVPKKGVNIDQLNEALPLQSFTDIRPANVNAWPYVDVWNTGLACLPIAGTSQTALYSTWSFYYQVTGDKTASLSLCTAENIAGSAKQGAWYVGPTAPPPQDAALNDYLFSLPEAWAAANTGGRSLVTGRNREGGLSGLGPTFYAVAPVNFNNPPSPGSVLPAATLLQYGPVENSDGYNFPDAMIGYSHADWFRGGAWIGAGNQAAVILAGNKARGEMWYGYFGEEMRHDWVIADIPYPEFALTDPDGKGWRGSNKIPIVLLYDPADLARVAQGAAVPSTPQPYAAVRLDTAVFFGPQRLLRDIAFDAANSLLYTLEFVPESDGRVIVHVWKIRSGTTGVASVHRTPDRLTLFPSPVSDHLTILSNPPGARCTIEICDLLGRRTRTESFTGAAIDTRDLPPGLYQVLLRDGDEIRSGRFIVRR